MTERQLLDSHERRIRRRLSGHARILHDELERAIGPTVRKYPRAGLAAGASAGFLAGSVAGVTTRGGGGAVAAAVGALLGLLKGTGAAALRATLTDAFTSLARPEGE